MKNIKNKTKKFAVLFLIIFFVFFSLKDGYSKIYDLKIKNKLKHYKKIKNLQLKPLGNNLVMPSSIDFETIKVSICTKEKPKSFFYYDKKEGCYWTYKKIPLLQLEKIEKNTIITSPKKVKPLTFNAIPAISGKLSIIILNQTEKNIDTDMSNETLIKAFPFLNSSLYQKGNVTIAVIDSGISDNIWFFNASIVKLGTYYDYDTSNCVYNYSNWRDEEGHGTHIISIIHSINPKAKIISIKLLSWDSASVICGINKAIQLNASIISLSLGYFPQFFDCFNDLLCLSVNYATQHNNTLFVVAAGNEGNQRKHLTINNNVTISIIEGDTQTIEANLIIKTYDGTPINAIFYDTNGTEIGKIVWNETLNDYTVMNTSTLSFDIDEDGINDILDTQSDYSSERNLEINFKSNTLSQINIKINTPSTKRAEIFLDKLDEESRDILTPNDPYATITSPGISPYALTVGSYNIKNYYYYLNQTTQDYFLVNLSSIGTLNNVSSFSSRGSLESNNIKPEIIAPGAFIWGAYLNNDNYFIFNKTLNLQLTELIIPIYGDNNSYIVPKLGTSMATPIISSLASIIKAIMPHASPELIKAIILNSTTLNNNLAELTEKDRGYGLVNYSLIEENIPTVNLTNYSVDYINKILTLNIFNEKPFPIPFINISIEENISKISSLNDGNNKITIQLPPNFDLSRNHTLLLRGDFLNSPLIYNLSFKGPNITITNVTYITILNLSNNGFSITNLTLNITLAYLTNFVGNISCNVNNLFSFIMEENTTKTITVPVFLNEAFPLKINCTNNINELEYPLSFSLFKQDFIITYSPFFNITFYNNLSNILENETLILHISNSTVTLKKGEEYNYNYSLFKLNNFRNIANDYTLTLTQGDFLIDNIIVSYYSNVTPQNLTIRDLVVDENNKSYIRPSIILIKRNDANPNCNLSYYLNNTLVLKKHINQTGLLILSESESKLFNISFNKNYLLNVSLKCKNNFVPLQTLNISFYYNLSEYEELLNKTFFYEINQSSFFSNITLNFFNLTNLTELKVLFLTNKLNKSFIYNNITQDFTKKGNNYSLSFSPYYFYLKNDYYPFYFNITNQINNSFVFNYLVSITLFTNKTKALYFTKLYERNFISPLPNITFSFKNTNIYISNLNYLNKNSTFIVNIKNKEKFPLNLSYNLTKNDGKLSINLTTYINSSSNTSLFMIALSPNTTAEGKESISIITSLANIYPNLSLFKFNQTFYYDTLYPLIHNFSVFPSNYFKNERKYYTNTSFNVQFKIEDAHFCEYKCIDLAVNNNTGVVFNIINNSLVKFFVNKSVLSYGLNKIYLYAQDKYGNRVNLSFDIVFDNISPNLNVYYNNSLFYKNIFIKVNVTDDNLWFSIVNNTDILTKPINLTNNQWNSLPCGENKNILIIKSYDKSNNSNSKNLTSYCFNSLNYFNITTNSPIYAIGFKNISNYKILFEFLNDTTYYKQNDHYYYLNKTYKLKVLGSLKFLALSPEIPISNFQFYKTIIKDEDYNLIKTLNYTLSTPTNIAPIILLENINDDTFYITVTLKKEIYNFSLLTNDNHYFIKGIPLTLKVENVGKIEIKNLNNNYINQINCNGYNSTLKIVVPCVAGINKLNITAFYSQNNSLSYSKEYSFYCLNDSLIKTDLTPLKIKSIETNISINSTIISINDSSIPDIINDTYLQKNINISPFLTNNTLILIVEYPLPDNFNVTQIYLNKSNTIIQLNYPEDYRIENGNVIIYLNITEDPILTIIAKKEEYLFTNNTEENNQEDSSSSTNFTENNEDSTNNNNEENSYSASSTLSWTEDNNYYPNNNNYSFNNSNRTISNINRSINNQTILIKGFSQNKTLLINVNNSFFPKVKIVINNNLKPFIFNFTYLTLNTSRNQEIWVLKSNNIIFSVIYLNITKFEKKYKGKIEIYKYKNIMKNPKNISFIVLKNNEKLVIKKKEETITLLKNKNKGKNKSTNSETTIQKNSQNKPNENKKLSTTKEKKSDIWKILKYLGIGILIFFIIDFLDFIYKKKKGII